MSDVITRKQTINFLGFLRGQLNGLQGIPTLCYELIQNADDVKDEEGNPGASRISFDVCDDALYVYNDGVFRDIDFERMEKLSWGNKREEEGTTGAFGLGFISVYQITDAPEIFSSDLHWQFNPNGHEDERILERSVETKATKFRLPWSFDESEIRVELGIPPINKDMLNYYTHQIEKSIEAAALFLKQVNVLKVQRNGELIREIIVAREGDELLISDGEEDIIFRIYRGRFDEQAKEMREKYGKIIEKKRQPEVKIAIPDTPEVEGLLYAFLPSEVKTGLPFHINADFYPSPDRKRIIFDEGFKKEWNQSAILCATRTLAEHCEDLLEILSPEDFWEFADKVNKASNPDNLTLAFEDFWKFFKPEIMKTKSVQTSLETQVLPSRAIFIDTKDLVDAGEIFKNLGINTVHPDIRSKQNILLETGVKNIRIPHIHQGFLDQDLEERTEIHDMPEGLRFVEGWKVFWQAIKNLLDRSAAGDRYENEELLKNIPIVFGSDDALWPPSKLFKADPLTISFFSKFGSMVWFEDNSQDNKFLGEFVPQFTINDGLDILEKSEEDLLDLYRGDLFSPQEMLEWLEHNRDGLNFNHVERIKGLSLWPTAGKELRPLSDLFLAGDFEDPLQLAQLVDVDALGGSREFLERKLKVLKLNFVTYVRQRVPEVVANRELSSDEKNELVKVLAENKGSLVDYDDLREILSKLPIVWCGGEEFFLATEVWFDTDEVKDVLGVDIPLTKLPDEKQEAVRELYKWMGVSQEPAPGDIVKRIKKVVQDPPNKKNVALIGRLIGYIASKWVTWGEEQIVRFDSLRHFAWLPGTKDPSKWFGPQSVYSIYSRDLFDSVGNFLIVDYSIQRNSSDFFQFIGIESEPTPGQVVQHLLWSSKNDQQITNRIYNFLNFEKNVGSREINRLVGEKCLYLKDSEGNGAYYSPAQVFWEQHPFGDYRFRLPPEFGQYKDLMDRIGVKYSPNVDDAIKVILEISKKFGTSNIALPDGSDDEDILIFCWKMVSEALENEGITEKEINRKLKDQKTIPDSRKVLNQPVRMFFEDRPGWSEKFKLIEFNITPRIEGAWQGMEAAGVRPLSSVVTIEMVELNNRTEDTDLDYLLEERRNLIRRAIEQHRKEGNKDLSIEGLDNLNCYRADPIEIVRIFTGFKKQEKSELETVDAVLHNESQEVSDEKTLFFTVNNGSLPWRGIARELSYVINSTGEIRSLGMELKDILSQSFEEATLSLDELGYPKIEVKETKITEGVTLTAVDDTPPEIEGIKKPVPHPDGEEQGTTSGQGQGEGEGQKPGTVTGGGSGTGSKPSEAPKQHKRKTSRLVSYVYPDDAFTDREEHPQHAKKRKRVEEAGVEKVMQHERENGRNPFDMETEQIHHPGYDLESTSEDGSVRFIEVKSLSGTWDSQNPAKLTKMEFKVAKQKGKAFWLYVVERAESEDFNIHKIQDPGNRVDYYLFDHGWGVEINE